MKIGVISYGVGNVTSVVNFIFRCGRICEVIDDPKKLTNIDLIILPGVGSFDTAVEKLRISGFYEFLKNSLREDQVVCGICLGMQLMCNGSEEGIEKGLGFFNKSVLKFPDLPNIGWRNVEFCSPDFVKLNRTDILFPRFYFVHNYYVPVDDDLGLNLAHSDFQNKNFACALKKKNYIGFQFHPEKSHIFGEMLFKFVINFYE
jgi:glutamine amidotransferase